MTGTPAVVVAQPDQPSLARNRLATALRQARDAAAISGSQAAQAAGFGQSKLSKIERAELLPSTDDVVALCRAYGLPASVTQELAQLAAELKLEKSERLVLTRNITQMSRKVRRLEKQASAIRGFHPLALPALLQTPAYAAHLPRSAQPQPLTGLGAKRSRTTAVHLIIGEAALRARIAPGPVLADQLDALAIATTLPGFTLGLVAWNDALRVLPDHGFTLYDTTCVLVSVATASLAITTRTETAIYSSLFGLIAEQARYGDHARERMAAIAAQYRAQP